MDKLTEIMEWKRKEIAELIRDVPDSELEAFQQFAAQRGSFFNALSRESGLAVISEIKRRSPSAGQIKELPDSRTQAAKYKNSNADCLSILTDEKYFGGTLEDLRSVTSMFAEQRSGAPCLRKDFMVHPIQVVQAAEAGAAAILIIVRALNDDEMKALRHAADLAGLDSLYEIHTEPELEKALRHDPKILGVNNRDLATFTTDIAYSEKLIPQFPSDTLAISESGIWNKEDGQRAINAGAKAVLIGEALMKADSPDALISDLHNLS